MILFNAALGARMASSGYLEIPMFRSLPDIAGFIHFIPIAICAQIS